MRISEEQLPEEASQNYAEKCGSWVSQKSYLTGP
jgi:hypothetical protein